jgi:Holliday junction resolvase
MRESALQTRILEYLKGYGCYCVNVHGSSYGSKGTPDILVCCNGKFIAIETKVGKNVTSAAQEIHHERIKKAGGVVIVPYTFNEFLELFIKVVQDGS